MPNIMEELTAAVRNLPMLYQPIFSHEVKGIQPERICTDRLADVLKIYDALSKQLNRPLRVLDLGCNLGFFSLHAAKRGGVVTGVDFDDKNIRVCKILASENPDYKINFIQAKLEEFIPNIKDDEYDLVLCFSVLHWVTLANGLQFTQNLINTLADKVHTGIFELATKSEFPKNNLPADYRDLLKGYSFIRALDYLTWGSLRNFQRPFLFASKDYVHFDELGLLKIDEMVFHQHHPTGNIRYYHCGDKFIKYRLIADEIAEQRTMTELKVLKELGGQKGLPKLYASIIESDDAGKRSFIVRDKIDGMTLNKKITTDENIDRWDIVKQILQWVIFFEKHGYYQSDFNWSNLIYSDDGKIYPIDYELMVNEPVSMRWPYNFRMYILHFINGLFERDTNRKRLLDHTSGKMLTVLHRHVSEDQYKQILQLKNSKDFFQQLYEILFPTEKDSTNTIAELEILEIERYLEDLGVYVQENKNTINTLYRLLIAQQQRIDRLEKIIQEKLK